MTRARRIYHRTRPMLPPSTQIGLRRRFTRVQQRARFPRWPAEAALERKRYWLAEAACRKAENPIGPIRLEVAWGIPPRAVPRLMVAADCLLLTSAIEGSPNVVKEAVACGLPVVSTDVGDVRQVLSDVEPSWVCRSDRDQLAEALVQCLTEPRRSNGPDRSEWLGQEQIALRLLKLYQRLAPELSLTGCAGQSGTRKRILPGISHSGEATAADSIARACESRPERRIPGTGTDQIQTYHD